MRGNPLEILGVESGGAKAEGPRRGGAEGADEEEAFARSGSEKAVAGA